jgi:hypothetical protein
MRTIRRGSTLGGNVREREHQAIREALFDAPAYALFGDAYGQPPPAFIQRLYDRGRSLAAGRVTVPGDEGTLDIQYLLPLSEKTIALGELYGWGKLVVGVDVDGARVLVDTLAEEESAQVWVDPEADGDVVEAGVSLKALLKALGAR